MDHLFWCIGYELFLPDIIKGHGSFLYDSKKNKYVDLESGVWCTSLGHSHPDINEAIKDQIDKISHTGYCYSNVIADKASEKVLEIAKFYNGKCVFLSSGSESVEFGVQVMRKLTKKPMLLALADSFLGSYGSAKEKKRNNWYLLDWNSCKSCAHPDQCNLQCDVFSKIPISEIGGFVFEPGSSSGFVRFPPKAFIKNLVKLIKRNSGLIQINEVTTGIGRTGRWLGYQHYDINPDIISMGKGLGNGYPVSAIAMTSDVIDELGKISFVYSQSHQNDPLGCAVARKVISVIQRDKLIERSEALGKYFIEELKKITNKYDDVIKEVRGRGLMIAIELNEEYKNLAASFFKKLLDKGFIVAYGRGFLRLDPPLIIKKEDINGFLEAFDQILAQEKMKA